MILSKMLPRVWTLLIAGLVFPGNVGPAWGQCTVYGRDKVFASDAREGDRFGDSAAVVGDLALVGAPYWDDYEAISAGAAYVLRFDGSAWIQEQKLVASDLWRYAYFGIAVAIPAPDQLLIGAFNTINIPQGIGSGSVYFFSHDGATWVESQEFFASDAERDDHFGRSVGADGDTALVGAPDNDDFGSSSGAAYIFRYNGVSWVQEAKLLPSDGGPREYFGRAVAISGDLAVVGVPGNGFDDVVGAAYVFRRDGTSWIDEAELTPSDGQPRMTFGWSVAAANDTIAIGAPEILKNTPSGSAYVFRFQGGDWIEEARLVGADVKPANHFGYAVSIAGDIAVIGAADYEGHPDEDVSGSAHVFRFDGSSWIEEAKLLPVDGAPRDLFGHAVCIRGETGLIGAPKGMVEQQGRYGAVYVFDFPPPGDADSDGVSDLCDNCREDYNPEQGDCDLDGIGDVCAIAEGLAEDCNENGIPDSCDISDCDGSAWCDDCNCNGVLDLCDIADGTSEDLDGDGVPDECVPIPCPTDLDRDGDMDLADLAALLANYGATGGAAQEDGDIDADCDVDLEDLGALLGVYGTACE